MSRHTAKASNLIAMLAIAAMVVPLLWWGVPRSAAISPATPGPFKNAAPAPSEKRRAALPQGTQADSEELDRSPVDLALSPDGRWLVTANQIANTVSLIDTRSSQLVGETGCGEYPIDLAFTPDGQQLVVTSQWAGKLQVFEIRDDALVLTGEVQIGFDPAGLAITSDGKRVYVGQVANCLLYTSDAADE